MHLTSRAKFTNAACLAVFFFACVVAVPQSSNNAHKSVLKSRSDRVAQLCSKYAGPNDDECDAMKFNDARKLVFDYKLYGCVPRGAGSRFWDMVFNALTEDLNKRGSPDTPEKYVSFSTCRHPFQRIALAYAVEAKRAEKGGMKSQILPFTKFVEKEVIAAGNAGSWKNTYLRPCSLDCNPCCTHFDVLADFSTLTDDFNLIKSSQKLDHTKAVADFGDAQDLDGTGIDPTTMTRYFAGLPKAIVEGIYKVYKKDFELYGYKEDDYL